MARNGIKAIVWDLDGTLIHFAIDFNVFNWIGGFRNIMYPTVTKGALAYCNFLGNKVLHALKAGKKVRILDAGSGDGRNTMILWDYFRKKGCLYDGADIEFYGIDYSKEFVKIANFEIFGIARGVFKSTDKQFALLDKKVVNALKQFRESDPFLRGLVALVGFKRIEIPYKEDQRQTGKTKYSIKEMVKLALTGLTSFTDVPLYASFYLGLAAIAVSLLYAAYVIGAVTFLNELPSGWASTILVVVFLGGVQLFSIGILGV